MKAFIASLAIAFIFAVGPASAGDNSSSEDQEGCHHYKKWQDT